MSKLQGYVYGAIAVLGFGTTFIGLALGLTEFSPTMMAIGRIIPAGIGAIIALKIGGQSLIPPRDLWSRIWLVSGGLVFGYPILSTIAMRTVPASDAGVLIALSPVAGVITAILIFKNKTPSAKFWIGALGGTFFGMLFSVSRSNGLGGGEFWGYVIMAIAVVIGAVGNSSAGALTAKYKAFYVISWAIVISIPVMLPLTIIELILNPITVMPSADAWFGFLFVSLYSIFLGHYFWANALNTIGIAKASQLQLAQPIVTMVLAIFILRETVSAFTWFTAIAILICVGWTQRTNLSRAK
jgi:drug/metabolite transporter (DMT)-like permease